MIATHMRLYEIFAMSSAFMSAVHLLSCMWGAVKIAYPELAAARSRVYLKSGELSGRIWRLTKKSPFSGG